MTFKVCAYNSITFAVKMKPVQSCPNLTLSDLWTHYLPVSEVQIRSPLLLCEHTSVNPPVNECVKDVHVHSINHTMQTVLKICCMKVLYCTLVWCHSHCRRNLRVGNRTLQRRVLGGQLFTSPTSSRGTTGSSEGRSVWEFTQAPIWSCDLLCNKNAQ